MKYRNICKGIFLDRPNRFVAHVSINGKTETVHVKNTGRCKEILVPGTDCYLEKSENPQRKTQFDLVTVRKGKRLINIDSQAVNKVFEEYLKKEKLFYNITYLKPETVFGRSRFDFYLETDKRKVFIEAKGVTLENNNTVSFPDAPTERGTKHIYELTEAHKQGFETCIVFVVQMKDVLYFRPHHETDPKFAQALKEAEKAGVNIFAFDCQVTEDEIFIKDRVKVMLNA